MASIIKYGIIGLINTAFGYGVIFILIYLGVVVEISNFLGYVAGFFLSYFLNKRYNFRSNRSHGEDLPKFIVGMSIAYILNLITMIMLYRFLNVDVYLSQILSGIVYTISGYLLSKFWIFKN
jgi:putative flippase GtrA